MSELELLAAIDALQARYVRALDEADMHRWAACFGDPASYICIPRENVADGFSVATMLDDSKDRVLDRVKYVTEVWKGTFDEYTTRHFVQRVNHESKGGGLVRVESNFMIAYVTPAGVSALLATGVYEDEILVDGGEAVFRAKRVIVDSPTTPRYIVYPL